MIGTRAELYGISSKQLEEAREELESLLFFYAGLAICQPVSASTPPAQIEVSGVNDHPELKISYAKVAELHGGRPAYRHDERPEIWIHYSIVHGGKWLVGSGGPPRWGDLGYLTDHYNSTIDPVSAFRGHQRISIIGNPLRIGLEDGGFPKKK